MAATARALMGRARTTALSLWQQGSTVAQEQYAKTMKENVKYVVKDPEVEKILLKQWFFTKMSKIPATAAQVEQEAAALREAWGKRNELTVREVGIAGMFLAELIGWFCIGEIVGRGFTIVGYQV